MKDRCSLAEVLNRTVLTVPSDGWQDGAQVTVHTSGASTFGSSFVEVVGVVNDDGSIQEQRCAELGDTFGEFIHCQDHYTCLGAV